MNRPNRDRGLAWVAAADALLYWRYRQNHRVPADKEDQLRLYLLLVMQAMVWQNLDAVDALATQIPSGIFVTELHELDVTELAAYYLHKELGFHEIPRRPDRAGPHNYFNLVGGYHDHRPLPRLIRAEMCDQLMYARAATAHGKWPDAKRERQERLSASLVAAVLNGPEEGPHGRPGIYTPLPPGAAENVRMPVLWAWEGLQWRMTYDRANLSAEAPEETP